MLERNKGTCACRSGEPTYALLDAADAFVAIVCGKCEEATRKASFPRIFRGTIRYAAGPKLDTPYGPDWFDTLK